MNIDQATIEIRPRSVTEIVDLSLLFYRSNLGGFGKVLASHGLFIIVLSSLVHWATGGWYFGLLAYWYLSISLSGSLIAVAGQTVFGIPVSLAGILLSSNRYGWRTYLASLFHRTIWALFGVFFVGLVWRNKWGFTMCLSVLERLKGDDLTRRRAGLNIRAGTAKYTLDIASLGIASAYTLALLMFFELFLNDFITIWPESGLFHLDVLTDPIRAGIWMVAFTMARPIVDLSWLFLYIDTRTRGEGWDLELKFKSFAATRLSRQEQTVQ